MITKPEDASSTYTVGTCHEIGYGWRISAPAELAPARVEEIVDALIDWTDTPDQGELIEMLLNEFQDASDYVILCQIEIQVRCVHRDLWSQEFKG